MDIGYLQISKYNYLFPSKWFDLGAAECETLSATINCIACDWIGIKSGKACRWRSTSAEVVLKESEGRSKSLRAKSAVNDWCFAKKNDKDTGAADC